MDNDEPSKTPHDDFNIGQLHPNQLMLQQSRLLSELVREVSTIRKWVTFFGVVMIVVVAGWVLLLLDGASTM
jgi:hypothetical protein